MALLAAAGVSEHFTICSANPRTWPGDAYSRKVVKADFDVANTIRKKFGMHWSADGEFAGHDATFEETLQYWQSFRSNQSFAYTARREQFFPLATRMEVRGAGGEAYRDFWSAKIPKLPWYPELKHGPDNFHADVETAFANMVPRQVLRPQEWEAAFESCHFLIDWLKTRAPFWKLEETAQGSHWVEAKDSDDAAADKWKQP